MRPITNILFAIFAFAAAATGAETIQLATANGKCYGPFKVANGELIHLDDVTYVVTNVVERSVQDRLRDIVVPNIEIKKARLTEAVKVLQDASVAADRERTGVVLLLRVNDEAEHSLATFSGTNLCFGEALTILTKLYGITMRYYGGSVVLESKGLQGDSGSREPWNNTVTKQETGSGTNKGTRTVGGVDLKYSRDTGYKNDGTPPYYFSETDGSSVEKAIIIHAFNSFDGQRAEQHLLATKFPTSTVKTNTWVKDSEKWYHKYILVTKDSKESSVYIDATQYCRTY